MMVWMANLPSYFQADITDLACTETCNYNDEIIDIITSILHSNESVREKKKNRLYSRHVEKFGHFCDKFCGGIKVVDMEQMILIKKQNNNNRNQKKR